MKIAKILIFGIVLSSFSLAQEPLTLIDKESYSIDKLGYHQKVADNVSTVGCIQDIALDEVKILDNKAKLVSEEIKNDFYIAYYESDDNFIEIFGSYTLDKFILIWEPKKS